MSIDSRMFSLKHFSSRYKISFLPFSGNLGIDSKEGFAKVKPDLPNLKDR